MECLSHIKLLRLTLILFIVSSLISANTMTLFEDTKGMTPVGKNYFDLLTNNRMHRSLTHQRPATLSYCTTAILPATQFLAITETKIAVDSLSTNRVAWGGTVADPSLNYVQSTMGDPTSCSCTTSFSHDDAYLSMTASAFDSDGTFTLAPKAALGASFKGHYVHISGATTCTYSNVVTCTDPDYDVCGSYIVTESPGVYSASDFTCSTCSGWSG